MLRLGDVRVPSLFLELFLLDVIHVELRILLTINTLNGGLFRRVRGEVGGMARRHRNLRDLERGNLMINGVTVRLYIDAIQT